MLEFASLHYLAALAPLIHKTRAPYTPGESMLEEAEAEGVEDPEGGLARV